MTATTFRSASGEFTLLRRPLTPHLPLQAWNAADEYLLALVNAYLTSDSSLLVINDQFGALALTADKFPVISWGDSYTAHLATRENLQANQIDLARLRIVPATHIPTPAEPAEKFSIVLWRVPKNVSLMQQQATALRNCIDGETIIFAAGMQKHLPAQTIDILKTLGVVENLLTQKKARAYRIKPDLSLPCPTDKKNNPLRLEDYGLTLEAGPNVFAHDKFDIGARFFLEQFDKLPRAQHIADLGCGNGVLGIVAKQRVPTAQIEFFDESYQAIAAAEKNYRANSLSDLEPQAKFHIDDIFANYSGEPFDLILCNPPFHQGHVVGDHIAWEMFTQSKKNLRSGGELWIVGNRHLDYHIKLKKTFGNCRQIAANAKFVVLAAQANF